MWASGTKLATTPHCLSGSDARSYVSENDTALIEAYGILRGLNEDSHSIELKRIVVAVLERGLGRRVLKEISTLESEYN